MNRSTIKYIIITAIVCILSTWLIISCSNERNKDPYAVKNVSKKVRSYVTFENDGIVYIEYQGYMYDSYIPYYSKNGKLCHLVNGQIEEIE